MVLSIIRFRGCTAAANGLLQDANYVEVLLVEQDALLFQIVGNDSFMFTDRARTIIDLLQKHLHEISLAYGEIFNFLEMLLRLLDSLWWLQIVGETL